VKDRLDRFLATTKRDPFHSVWQISHFSELSMSKCVSSEASVFQLLIFPFNGVPVAAHAGLYPHNHNTKKSADLQIAIRQVNQGVSSIFRALEQAAMGAFPRPHGSRKPVQPPHDILWPMSRGARW
jgi:ketopantoate hydroxymethyltransferase